MNDESAYDKQLRRFVIPLLRRKSLHWPGRQEAKRDARRERGLYECFNCKQLFGPKEVEMDHKKPVINVKTSFTNFDDYIKSLYCDKSNFTCLCKSCHSIKTQIENERRSINKNKKKVKKKQK
jgi:5-methylcytosine-specific restriction endonuclease McrA